MTQFYFALRALILGALLTGMTSCAIIIALETDWQHLALTLSDDIRQAAESFGKDLNQGPKSEP